MAITPDGRYLYVATTGGTAREENPIKIININTGAVSATVRVSPGRHGVKLSADGRRAYVTTTCCRQGTVLGTDGPGGLSVIDTTSNTVVATLAISGHPGGMAVTSDGRFVYVTNYQSGYVSIVDTSTNTLSGKILLGDYTNSFDIVISSDDRRAYVATGSQQVSVIDIS